MFFIVLQIIRNSKLFYDGELVLKLLSKIDAVAIL